MKGGSKIRKETPDSMLSNGTYVKDNEKLAASQRQLGSCFLQDIPPLGANFEEINEKLYDLYQLNFREDRNHAWTNFNLKITTDTVLRMIKELKTNKDPGPMQIPAIFLQYNAELLAPVISNAINSMIQTGRITEDWKVSFITPIPKKGSPICIESYRGIAMQSCLPKILDKFITELLYKHLEPEITPNQHGFRRNKGTTTNLMEITQLLHENVKKFQVDVIYFDYSKAFDQIRHDLLAVKLAQYSTLEIQIV